MSRIDASIVVPTYNQAETLGPCLGSLLAQTVPADRYEIVVVDDGSTDRTPQMLAGYAAPVRVVRLPHNRGRSAARNAGVRESRSERVVFIDSDVVVRRDFLDWHLRTHHEHGPGILCRGPVVPVETLEDPRGPALPWLASSPAYLDTANASLERAAVIRAGMFDEAFPGYGWEDFELGARLQAMGIRRVFCRWAPAFHLRPPLDPKALDALFAKEEARARSAAYFFRKHPTLATRLLIQATPAHRVLFWMLAAAGALHRGNLPAVLARLDAGRRRLLAQLAARSVLNRHYLTTLERELALHGREVA